METINKRKISIIGAGAVGSVAAYALLIRGLASEIVLVDKNRDLAEGEAMDLAQGASFVKPSTIYAGDFKDCSNSEIVIITAGAAQKEGETRLDLLDKNIDVMKDITHNIVNYCPNSIYLVVTNPVDILTYVVYKLSGLPAHKVIGSGTVLDSSRFRHLLSEKCNVDARNVHAYVLGEHGDTEVLAWSTANIAGIPAKEFYKKCYNHEPEDNWYKKVQKEVAQAAYEIIEKKGATYYAVGISISRIVEAIIRDENSILTVSTLINDYFDINNIYLSLPCILNENGIKKILNVPLNNKEIESLQNSAATLQKTLYKFEDKIK